MSNTGIPKVNVSLGASAEDQPEVDVSDEEFMQFDTSGVPVVVTLTKVLFNSLLLIWLKMSMVKFSFVLQHSFQFDEYRSL